MNILIKTTVSNVFGLGHISRMHSLSKQLSDHQIYFQVDGLFPTKFLFENEIEFHDIYKLDLIAPLNLNDLKYINRSKNWHDDINHTIRIIQKYSIDIIICDLPAINQFWINEVKIYAGVVVFDDIPIARINADIIVNPNNAYDFMEKYIVKNQKNLLIGQEYNPINKCYWQKNCEIKNDIKNILVYLGSAVSFEITKSIIEPLIPLKKQINYIGEYSSRLNYLYKGTNFFKSKKFVENFYEEYKNADICIGACGVSFWERCHLGIPSIILKTAENQIKDIEYLNNIEAIIEIDLDNINASLVSIFSRFEKDINLIKILSKKSYSVVCNSYNVNIAKSIIDSFTR